LDAFLNKTGSSMDTRVTLASPAANLCALILI
jgi:hypothetical protein